MTQNTTPTSQHWQRQFKKKVKATTLNGRTRTHTHTHTRARQTDRYLEVLVSLQRSESRVRQLDVVQRPVGALPVASPAGESVALLLPQRSHRWLSLAAPQLEQLPSAVWTLSR